MAEESKAVVSAGKTALQAQPTFRGSPIQLRSLDEYLKLGDVLWKSGYFGDVKSAAQAVAKMIAGAEMGFGPMASLSGVYIQGSRPSFMANLIAAAVKKNGYDYSVDVLTDTECKLTFYGKGGKLLGVSVFTIEDAKQAELTIGRNAHSWKHYPRNMVFSRAMSNGARWYCPDIFGGVTPYTPDELDYVIDGETGEAIDTVVSPNGTQPPQPEPVKPAPFAPVPAGVPEPKTIRKQDGDGVYKEHPVTEQAPVSELDEHFGTPSITKQEEQKMVKIWNGKEWQERKAYDPVGEKAGEWFIAHFVGKNKDGTERAFKNQWELLGNNKKKQDGTDENVGHLGNHYKMAGGAPRRYFYGKEPMLNWEFAELVAYAWWKQGDREHGTLSLPRYQDKLKEELDKQDAIPYDSPETPASPEKGASTKSSSGVPDATEVEERAKKLGVDVMTLAHMMFTAEAVPFLVNTTEHQRTVLWECLNGVEIGHFKPDDFDAMVDEVAMG